MKDYLSAWDDVKNTTIATRLSRKLHESELMELPLAYYSAYTNMGGDESSALELLEKFVDEYATNGQLQMSAKKNGFTNVFNSYSGLKSTKEIRDDEEQRKKDEAVNKSKKEADVHQQFYDYIWPNIKDSRMVAEIQDRMDKESGKTSGAPEYIFEKYFRPIYDREGMSDDILDKLYSAYDANRQNEKFTPKEEAVADVAPALDADERPSDVDESEAAWNDFQRKTKGLLGPSYGITSVNELSGLHDVFIDAYNKTKNQAEAQNLIEKFLKEYSSNGDLKSVGKTYGLDGAFKTWEEGRGATSEKATEAKNKASAEKSFQSWRRTSDFNDIAKVLKSQDDLDELADAYESAWYEQNGDERKTRERIKQFVKEWSLDTGNYGKMGKGFLIWSAEDRNVQKNAAQEKAKAEQDALEQKKGFDEMMGNLGKDQDSKDYEKALKAYNDWKRNPLLAGDFNKSVLSKIPVEDAGDEIVLRGIYTKMYREALKTKSFGQSPAALAEIRMRKFASDYANSRELQTIAERGTLEDAFNAWSGNGDKAPVSENGFDVPPSDKKAKLTPDEIRRKRSQNPDGLDPLGAEMNSADARATEENRINKRKGIEIDPSPDIQYTADYAWSQAQIIRGRTGVEISAKNKGRVAEEYKKLDQAGQLECYQAAVNIKAVYDKMLMDGGEYENSFINGIAKFVKDKLPKKTQEVERVKTCYTYASGLFGLQGKDSWGENREQKYIDAYKSIKSQFDSAKGGDVKSIMEVMRDTSPSWWREINEWYSSIPESSSDARKRSESRQSGYSSIWDSLCTTVIEKLEENPGTFGEAFVSIHPWRGSDIAVEGAEKTWDELASQFKQIADIMAQNEQAPQEPVDYKDAFEKATRETVDKSARRVNESPLTEPARVDDEGKLEKGTVGKTIDMLKSAGEKGKGLINSVTGTVGGWANDAYKFITGEE